MLFLLLPNALAAVVALTSPTDGTFHAEPPTFTWSTNCPAPTCTYWVELAADPAFLVGGGSPFTTGTSWTIDAADWADGAAGPWRAGVYARVHWTHTSGATGVSATRRYVPTLASFEGLAAGDRFGRSTLTADADGDGLTDLWVAAPRLDDSNDDGSPGVEAYAGAAWLFPGPHAGAYSTADAAASITGDRRFRAGSSIATGDFDGDGLLDLALGAARWPGDGSDLGAVYVFYGPVAGELELDDADVVIEGELPEGRFGYALAAPDLDADGLADLVVGEPGLGGAGAGYLWYGSGSWAASSTTGGADVAWSGTGDEALGYSVTAIDHPQNVDGDGVILGAPGSDLGAADGGAVYAMWSTTRYAVDEPVLDAALGWGWGDGAGDRLGASVGALHWGTLAVPVLPQGGYLLGLPGDGGSREGRVLGGSGIPWGAQPETSLYGTANLRGSDASERCGVHVAGAGDHDGDGYEEYLVACSTANGRGRLYVVGWGAPVDTTLSTWASLTLDGASSDDQLGRGSTWMPDVDGDGDDELVLGVPRGLTVGGIESGTVHLVAGAP